MDYEIRKQDRFTFAIVLSGRTIYRGSYSSCRRQLKSFKIRNSVIKAESGF